MNLLRLFGFCKGPIIAKNCFAKGTVTKIYRCRWLTINTKPVRRFSGDGAVYPHIITFDYQVNGIAYQGKLYIPVRYRVPAMSEMIDVYYDPDKPENYACYAFGPANHIR